MTRQLRSQAPGKWHHVMNRGARRLPIFADPLDHHIFLDRLGKGCGRSGVRVHAYALMPNHFHLLVYGDIAGVSALMQTTAGEYTVAFNRRHGLDGPLLRGRFRSKAVEDEAHLKELVRYIHRNPLGDGPPHPDRFRWTSHPRYLGDVDVPEWLSLGLVDSLFLGDINEYRRWVEADAEHIALLPQGRLARVRPVGAKEVDTAVGLASAPERHLLDSGSRLRRRHRDTALILATELARESVDELARHYGFGAASSVRSAASRARARAERDPELARLVSEARLRLIGRTTRAS